MAVNHSESRGMAYDTKLSARIEKHLSKLKSLEQKRMFGGLCFLYRGNMLCGVTGNKLMLRVGPEQYERTLKLKHASKMEFTGKALKGFVFVSPSGVKNKRGLAKWLKLATHYCKSLPAKTAKASEKIARGREVEFGSSTPLSKLKNFGPITRRELSSMGITNYGHLERLGFEAACRAYVRSYPERLNANAFLGILCTLEHTVWTQATPNQRAAARGLAKLMRQEFGLR